MKLYLSLLITILLISCRESGTDDDSGLQELYTLLDSEIARSKVYETEKENRIAQLHKSYDLAHDNIRRKDIVNRLIEEFDAYNADSTLYYVNCNLRNPETLAEPHEYTGLLIKKADVFAHAGLFPSALATMEEVRRDSPDADLMEDFYSTYCVIYQYLSEYTGEHETSMAYERQRALYADTLSQVVSPESFNHMVYVMTEKARKGESDKAIEILSGHLEEYRSGSREYSILASILAYIHKSAGHTEEYKRYLVLSAISDVRGAIKENMSFREVATVMFRDGDIERANRYLKKSIADANFYSTPMRNAQSSKMLPVIDEAYTSLQDRMTGRLRNMTWGSCALSVILVITMLLMLKQFKSLRMANAKVSRANNELSEMSCQLKDSNAKLQKKNDELSGLSESLKNSSRELAEKNEELSLLSGRLKSANAELEYKNAELHDYNRIKEQYAGLFMEYCSSAIYTLQHYQQSLRILNASGGNRSALIKKIESSDMADQLLKNFYVKFDEAILNIYPTFVDKFNSLLNPDDKVVLKSGEMLNTELRLFALICIGIDDSAKIAKFLRCSISTVYTYRSKMRKRAVDPGNFEANVKNIRLDSSDCHQTET